MWSFVFITVHLSLIIEIILPIYAKGDFDIKAALASLAPADSLHHMQKRYDPAEENSEANHAGIDELIDIDKGLSHDDIAQVRSRRSANNSKTTENDKMVQAVKTDPDKTTLSSDNMSNEKHDFAKSNSMINSFNAPDDYVDDSNQIKKKERSEKSNHRSERNVKAPQKVNDNKKKDFMTSANSNDNDIGMESKNKNSTDSSSHEEEYSSKKYSTKKPDENDDEKI
ncbi:WD repeat-containing protein 48 homolog [Xenia sp. Carnegie-2017]|uniref:WD repeat-containing protein 48 homolog n=1 Tax=Xenia sp. Carnegie-2017 TaxID=2897299 RepID=UPI001F03CC9B|nr:WD repeat-containing protein 48 homolog [Xenia sp. Carnegie-2017]XP_046842097.1 WD repeat-containing protein 48 homolog [Xenia sp. Carnegie-2017]